MRMSAVLRTVIDRKKNENEIYYDILSYKDLADSKEVLPTEEEIAIMKKDVEEPDFMLKLIKSFAPEVYGLDSVKESLILGLAGGVRSRNKRGSVNILLLGDPSTAKSTLLKECAEVITKSLYTSGKSASAEQLIKSLKAIDDRLVSHREYGQSHEKRGLKGLQKIDSSAGTGSENQSFFTKEEYQTLKDLGYSDKELEALRLTSEKGAKCVIEKCTGDEIIISKKSGEEVTIRKSEL